MTYILKGETKKFHTIVQARNNIVEEINIMKRHFLLI